MNNFLFKDNISHLDERTIYDEDKKHLFYIDEDGYFISDWIASGNMAEDKNVPVTYKINKDGFRSKHFQEFDKNKDSILFGGCSWTFGEGLPEEYSWTYLLKQKIEKQSNKELDLYNTAYMGSSIDLVIKNTMAFIRKYGKPNYIVLLFPDIARKTIYNNKLNSYIKAYASPEFLAMPNQHIQKRYTLSYEYENNAYQHLSLIYMLEDYCKEAGIKLIWSSWFIPDYEVYDNCNFNFFIKQDINENEDYFIASRSIQDQDKWYYENKNNLPYWYVAKDNAHPGTAWTEFMSTLMFDKMIKDGSI
jgi:hypothetical protein